MQLLFLNKVKNVSLSPYTLKSARYTCYYKFVLCMAYLLGQMCKKGKKFQDLSAMVSI